MDKPRKHCRCLHYKARHKATGRVYSLSNVLSKQIHKDHGAWRGEFGKTVTGTSVLLGWMGCSGMR
jgi:hypothetical protein